MCASRKLLHAKGHLEGPTEMQNIRQKITRQGCVHRQKLLSVLRAAPPKKVQGRTLGLAQGELKDFKANTKTTLFSGYFVASRL